MSLSLKEKQLLRSVVELIIQNPLVAKKLFSDVQVARDEEFSFTLDKIKPLISLVNNYDAQGEIYLNQIQELIGQLNDTDVRSIVKSTLASRTEHINPSSVR